MDTLLALFIGVGLSAATGLRVLIPPFLAGLAAANGHLELTEEMAWLADPLALKLLGAGMVLEIICYCIPWLDNLLDVIVAPVAVIAGVLLTAGFISDMTPVLRWSLAIIAGGGAVVTTQGISTAARAVSSASTGGIANPAVSAVEAISSALLALLVIALPVLAVITLIGFFILLRSLLTRLAARLGVRKGRKVAITRSPT